MIDKNEITLREVGNDGSTIYLYYDEMAGLYLAFGLSAYYTTLVADPYMSYSDEMQMPVALLRREHILLLRQGLRKVSHEAKRFYRFQLKTEVGDAGYDRWSRTIRDRHLKVYR